MASASNVGGGSRAEAEAERLIEFDRIYHYFDADVPTLRNVCFALHAGEFAFLTGASGSGKSTLLRLIYRALVADQGRVLFCGRDLAQLSAKGVARLRRQMGIVFQDFRVVPHWTVFANCAVPLEVLDVSRAAVRAAVAWALEQVGLAGRGRERVGALSGGERQRVAIARAIATRPLLVLADEPTGNLDPQLSIDVLTLFEELNQQGTAVLFATHDQALLQKRSHRVIALDGGFLDTARRCSDTWPVQHRVHPQAIRATESQGATGASSRPRGAVG